MNIQEKYTMERLIQSHDLDAPTQIRAAHFAILKIVLMLTMMHIETLIIFSLIQWLQPSFFWTVELVITTVLLLRLPGGWINKQFCAAYEVVPEVPAYVSEIEERVQRSAVVREAL